MKRIILVTFFSFLLLTGVQGHVGAAVQAPGDSGGGGAYTGECGKHRTFFGIPTWYKYLDFEEPNCDIVIQTKLDDNGYVKKGTVEGLNGDNGIDCYTRVDETCVEKTGKPDGIVNSADSGAGDFKDIGLIALAVIEMLLTLAGILAVIYVTIGGFKYVTSQGNPDSITKAKNTIVNALIGLVLALFSAQIIGFIARSLS